MPNEFSHKGVTISLDGNGTFWFPSKTGKSVNKPSLKAAQNAIDKEVGAVIVPAMKGDGEMLKIAGKDPKGGYVDAQGRRTFRYFARILTWDEDASRRIDALRQQEHDEYQRHHEVMDGLSKQRQAIWGEVGEFNYDAAVTAELARQRDQTQG